MVEQILLLLKGSKVVLRAVLDSQAPMEVEENDPTVVMVSKGRMARISTARQHDILAFEMVMNREGTNILFIST